MMIKNINNNSSSINFIVILVATISVSIIIFSLAIITTIEPIYANHTKYHLNNSLVDVTISGDDIPDALLEDIKRNIARNMIAEEKKAYESNNNNNNVSQLQQQTETTTNTKGKIILSSHKYIETDDDETYDELSGQVKNVGNGTAEDVQIIFTYYDINGNAIGNDNTGIYANILNSGQKSSFLGWRDVTKTNDMAYYEIALSWYNSDGSQEYIENIDVTKDPYEKIPVIENTIEKTNEKKNIPFFNTNGNDIEKLGNEEERDEEDKNNDKDEDNKDEDNNNEDNKDDEDDNDN